MPEACDGAVRTAPRLDVRKLDDGSFCVTLPRAVWRGCSIRGAQSVLSLVELGALVQLARLAALREGLPGVEKVAGVPMPEPPGSKP